MKGPDVENAEVNSHFVPRPGHSSIICRRLLLMEAVIHAKNRGSSLFDERSSDHTSHLTKTLG